MIRPRSRVVTGRSSAQLAAMRRAGLVVGETLQLLRDAVAPGVSTGELDRLAEEAIRSRGGVPSFLGYQGYPASICASINEIVVHGIPSDEIRLVAGDIISIDCGAIVDGWHGDSAITVACGEVTTELTRLMEVTEQAMWRGFAAAAIDGHLTDIGYAIEQYVRSAGDFGIVEDYGGHGIGRQMHEEPLVLNYAPAPGRGPKLSAGTTLAIEPMLTLGSPDTFVHDDEWTVETLDGGAAAHFEHTFVITRDGPFALTALDGGRQAFAALGIEIATLDR